MLSLNDLIGQEFVWPYSKNILDNIRVVQDVIYFVNAQMVGIKISKDDGTEVENYLITYEEAANVLGSIRGN